MRGKDLNLRPSGYEPDELPDCSTPRELRRQYYPFNKIHSTQTPAFPSQILPKKLSLWIGLNESITQICKQYVHRLGRPGSDLLFHALRRSTIGAKGFHGRVRDGIGCRPLAITTRSSKTASERMNKPKVGALNAN